MLARAVQIVTGRGDGSRREAAESVTRGVDGLKEAAARLDEALGPRELTLRLVMSEQRRIVRGK